MNFVRNDGGRAAAGFKGLAGDCVVRAIAIIAELDYAEIYARLKTLQGPGFSPRTGVAKPIAKKFLLELGFVWTPTMLIGQGCKVHLRADELPPGRIIVQLSKHKAAVIDGVLHDTYDCSRNGNRCVYGYWRKA